MSGDLAQNMQILYNLKYYLIPNNEFLPSLLQFVTVDYVGALQVMVLYAWLRCNTRYN